MIHDDLPLSLSGKRRVAVVQQFYETRVIDEFVLRGNTATLKCLVPSFVADFVDVIEWLAVEDGSTYTSSNQDEKGTVPIVLRRRMYTKGIFNERALILLHSYFNIKLAPI